jgi:hypothetical protein
LSPDENPFTEFDSHAVQGFGILKAEAELSSKTKSGIGTLRHGRWTAPESVPPSGMAETFDAERHPP